MKLSEQILSSAFSAASFLIVWLSQGYFKQINLPITAMGWTWALFHLLMSLASVNASRLKASLGIKKALLVLVLLLGTSYILLGSINSIWGIAFIAVIYAVRGMKSPLILNLINRQIPSSIRATVLSLNSFAFHLGFALIAPVIGAIASARSLSSALIVGGGFFLFTGSFCWWQLFKFKAFDSGAAKP
ncbi:MFS transporter [Hyella patelloides]|uniref:MFS transporter n=1 Tax=Hyella patelloides TaxID=1982969 RepID=UPI00119E07FA|nr:MFS transporter [Hyella patelloides]